MDKKPRIIALSGKGGVGKTSISAVIVKLLVEAHPDKKILAIDADPAVGLSTALGIEVETTVDDIRKEIVDTVEDGNTKSAIELLGESRYKIFDALIEKEGFSFIAIGRPESAGCYCRINNYLKEVINYLASNYDYIVIDGEAGIEQINRRVMEKVTDLLLISDTSKKGTQVIQTIKSVADELVMYDNIGVIINRAPSLEVKQYIDVGDIKMLAYILSDNTLAEYDLKGENVFEIDDASLIVKGTKEALDQLGLL